MILTASEAKTKKCCQSTDMFHNCIANGCMGWIWDSTIEEIIYEESKQSYFPTLPEVKRTIYKPKDEWTGYCGVAGK